MARVGIVTADFVAKTAKFTDGTKKARGALTGFRKDVKQTQAAIKGLFAVASGSAIVKFTKNTLAWADELNNAAARAGLATDAVQALRLEAEKFGMSTSGTDTALQRFSRRIGEAQQGTGQLLKVFEQYSISLRDKQGNQRTTTALLEDYTRVLQGVESSSERNRISMAAFDTEGVKLGQMLANNNGTIAETTQRLTELGRVVGNDSVREAAALETKWTELTQTMSASMKKAALSVTSMLTRAFNYWSERIAGTAKDLANLNKMSDEVQGIARKIQALESDKNPWFGKFLDPGNMGKRNQDLDKQIAKQKTLMAMVKDFEMGERKPPPSFDDIGGGGGTRGRASGIKAVSAAQEELNRMMAEGRILAEQLRTPVEKYADQMSELHTLLNTIRDGESAITMETFTRATAKYQEELHAATAQIEETNDFAKELGMTFTSAFEDAIVEGNSLRDVLKGLEQDMIRIITRQLVTTRLSNAIGGMVSGESGGLLSGLTSAISGIFGGARAAGGPVNTGKAYLVGENGPELFVPNTGGNISPSAATVVNVNFNAPVTGEGVRQSAQQIAAQVGAQTRRAMARNG